MLSEKNLLCNRLYKPPLGNKLLATIKDHDLFLLNSLGISHNREIVIFASYLDILQGSVLLREVFSLTYPSLPWNLSDLPKEGEAGVDLLAQEDSPFFQEEVVEEEEEEIEKFIDVQQCKVLRNLLMYNFV